MMVRSFHYVTTEEINLPMYDGLTTLDEFMNDFEIKVPEQQWFDALKWALHATHARWWGTHQQSFRDWCEYRKMMLL